METSVIHFEVIASCLVTRYHWKESGSIFFVYSHQISWSHFFCRLNSPELSASPSMGAAVVPQSPAGPTAGLTPVCPCLHCTGMSRVRPSTPDVLPQWWAAKEHLFLKQLGRLLPIFPASRFYWFMVNFVSTRTPVFAVFLCKTAAQLARPQTILLHGLAALPIFSTVPWTFRLVSIHGQQTMVLMTVRVSTRRYFCSTLFRL